jgi:hypothetical protein
MKRAMCLVSGFPDEVMEILELKIGRRKWFRDLKPVRYAVACIQQVVKTFFHPNKPANNTKRKQMIASRLDIRRQCFKKKI